MTLSTSQEDYDAYNLPIILYLPVERTTNYFLSYENYLKHLLFHTEIGIHMEKKQKLAERTR